MTLEVLDQNLDPSRIVRRVTAPFYSKESLVPLFNF